MILALTGSKAQILLNPDRSPGVQRMRADLSKAARLLGYTPRVSLEEGLQRMLAEDARFHLTGKAEQAQALQPT